MNERAHLLESIRVSLPGGGGGANCDSEGAAPSGVWDKDPPPGREGFAPGGLGGGGGGTPKDGTGGAPDDGGTMGSSTSSSSSIGANTRLTLGASASL